MMTAGAGLHAARSFSLWEPGTSNRNPILAQVFFERTREGLTLKYLPGGKRPPKHSSYNASFEMT